MKTKQTTKEQHPPSTQAAGSAESLVAAIEGNLNGMAHGDLVLTCKMLERGRATWRKEAEAFKATLSELVSESQYYAHDRGGKFLEVWERAHREVTQNNKLSGGEKEKP